MARRKPVFRTAVPTPVRVLLARTPFLPTSNRCAARASPSPFSSPHFGSRGGGGGPWGLHEGVRPGSAPSRGWVAQGEPPLLPSKPLDGLHLPHPGKGPGAVYLVTIEKDERITGHVDLSDRVPSTLAQYGTWGMAHGDPAPCPVALFGDPAPCPVREPFKAKEHPHVPCKILQDLEDARERR